MFQKKILYKLFFLLAVLAVCFQFHAQAQSLGDVNGDNSVTIVDALMTAQYYVGLNPVGFNNSQADVNCDSRSDILDALIMAQYYVGLINTFPCNPTPQPTAGVTPTLTPGPTTTGISNVSCAGYPIWNSAVTYNQTGALVQYNCKLYRNKGFAFNLNPEENSYNEWCVWALVGNCTGDCRMGEGPWVSCGQWEHWDNGGYTLYNNIWGSGAGTQCIWVESCSNWGVTANHPNTSGVKSYPNASKNIDRRVSALSSLSSSFNVSVPGSGSYATTYDIWADSNQYEIMLWVNKAGAVGPIARAWDDDGTPLPEATNQSVGGHTWNVYKGNIGFTVISFVRTSNTNSGTVNIKAILDYIRSQGWFGDVTLGKAQFGFEITSSSGGLDFTCNSYSMN